MSLENPTDHLISSHDNSAILISNINTGNMNESTQTNNITLTTQELNEYALAADKDEDRAENPLNLLPIEALPSTSVICNKNEDGNGAVFQNFKNTGSLVNSSVTSNLTINKNKESKVTVEIGQLCEEFLEKDENNKLKLDSKTLLGYIGGAEEISTNLMKLEEALDPAVKTLFPDKLRLDTNFEDSLKILLNTFGNNLIKELVTDKSDGGWSLLEALGKEPENKFWDFIQKSLKQVDSATCEGQGEKIVNAIGGVASLKVPFVDVVATFIKNRDKNHVEELLKAKKEKGWNFLHFVSRHNEEIRILDLLQIILDKLDRPLVLDLLQEKTEDGWTFLHIMCESTAKDLLINVLDWIENNFGPNNIKNLLTNKSKINSTCLMILSERNEKTSVLDFFKCLTEHLDKDVLRNFMLEQNNNEDSFLTVINEKSNGNSMMELLECINEYLGKELTVKLISLKNNVDRNILLHLENFKDKSLIESLKKFVLS